MDPLSCVYPEYEYGPCGCGSYFEHRWVEVSTVVAEERVVLTDVPQGACPSCGSRVFKAEILEMIDAIVAGQLPLSAGTAPPTR